MPDTAGMALQRCLKDCELCKDWPDDAVASLAVHCRLERYSRGRQVLAHDPARRDVLVVAGGCLEVTRSSAVGKRFLLSLVGRGQVVALVRLLPAQEPTGYEYHAHEETDIVHVPVGPLLSLLDERPVLWRSVALLMLERQRGNIEALHDIAVGSLTQRVAATLDALGRLHGAPTHDGLLLQLRLSQDDLGAMLGVSRQTVNKELRALEHGGVIGVDYNTITIRDRHALWRLAAGQA
jgi:CRP-like cAMP-binding protein